MNNSQVPAVIPPQAIESTEGMMVSAMMLPGRYEAAMRVAETFAKSEIVPAQYRQKPADCFVALCMAHDLGLSPFTVMMKSYVVKGKLAFEAQFLIALANTRGPFAGPIQFRGNPDVKDMTHDDFYVEAYATIRATGKEVSMKVTRKMVKDEGWDSNPKWKTLPALMYRYRSAAFLINVYCPEVKLGMLSVEEVEDSATIDVTPIHEPERPAGKPVADQPVIISQLQADLKGAGVAQSVALETAKEMFAGDGSVFSAADKPRLEHLTREQAGRLVEKCREEAMKKMGEASNG